MKLVTISYVPAWSALISHSFPFVYLLLTHSSLMLPWYQQSVLWTGTLDPFPHRSLLDTFLRCPVPSVQLVCPRSPTDPQLKPSQGFNNRPFDQSCSRGPPACSTVFLFCPRSPRGSHLLPHTIYHRLAWDSAWLTQLPSPTDPLLSQYRFC